MWFPTVSALAQVTRVTRLQPYHGFKTNRTTKQLQELFKKKLVTTVLYSWLFIPACKKKS
jgi:predicted dithiol-disulfide oxidoreductase (DUF899 family)